jgi:DNA-binding MarR family transcriptional regulator
MVYLCILSSALLSIWPNTQTHLKIQARLRLNRQMMHMHVLSGLPSTFSRFMTLTHLPCYCATLRQASRVVTSVYDKHLRSAGLRVTQFTLLQALHLSPGSRIVDLVGVLAMEQSTLTRTVGTLQGNGWVQVADRPSGREKCWELTAEGKAVFDAALPLWQAAQKTIEQRYGHDETLAMHTRLFELTDSAAS